MVSKDSLKESVPTYKDFEIDEGVLIKGALVIDLDNIDRYSFNTLKLCAEQLGILGWEKVSDRRILADAIQEQRIFLTGTNEEYLDNLPAKQEVLNPIPVYLSSVAGNGGRTLIRLFGSRREYLLITKDGMPVMIVNYYPDLTVTIWFTEEGKLTLKKFLFKGVKLEVIDDWLNQERTRIYKLKGEQIDQSEALELVSKLSNQIQKVSNLIKPLSGLVADYLLTV